ncbi:acetamidase/formamidase family protein [Dyella sp. 7MK23]|uniref:Acetamidase/formamidase family protein n=2 Tax=Dyella acidiphila TaxID=2775866 RepID=A0ABR9GC72_9GAMM|nr:acetamidase/formamidase family protein [Dyella acidiphila]MBE1161639.1 acetamidase/formamidase family protein [Dyella acidiphila]
MGPEQAPALRIAGPGTLVFETCDCFEDQIQSADAAFGELDWQRVNPATGPVYIDEAQPGDVLAVHIERIALNRQAVMVTAPKLGVCGDQISAPTIRVIPIADGHATLPQGVRVPLNPMIGVIGTAPAGAPVSCGTPDAHGGNMDCKIIAEGTTLYLPVNVPGALLAMGDLHAAMGDGEVSVCGMEIAGEVTVRVAVLKNHELPTPMAQTADAIYTIASAPLLDDAANLAARNMASFVSKRAGMSIDDAVNLLSVAGDLQICQVVDPQKTCRYALPKSIARQLNISLQDA